MRAQRRSSAGASQTGRCDDEVAQRLGGSGPATAIETHSCGPWWPPPIGPNSTAGTPACRNEIASDAPSRPT